MRSLRKGIVLSLALFSMAGADIYWPDALFASVVNISQNDVLNVRKKPDSHSAKIGYLPLDAFIGVDECRDKKGSTWCKIHHIAQRDYKGYGYDAPDGWVNAKYLCFGSDSGYVLVDGKGNCDYVIGCNHKICDIVVDYTVDENNTISSLKTQKIARKRLRGASNFGAAAEDMEGYCTKGAKVEDYLRERSPQQTFGDGNLTKEEW